MSRSHGNSPYRSLLERSISSGLQGGPRHGSVCPGRCFLEAAEKVGSTRCCSVWCLVPLLGGVVRVKSLMTSGKGTHVPKYSPERSLRAAASTVSPAPANRTNELFPIRSARVRHQIVCSLRTG